MTNMFKRFSTFIFMPIFITSSCWKHAERIEIRPATFKPIPILHSDVELRDARNLRDDPTISSEFSSAWKPILKVVEDVEYKQDTMVILKIKFSKGFF